MNKLNIIIEISIISSILAVLKEIWSDISISYIILLVLIVIDTITGMAGALKYGYFNSKGLMKLLKKVILYSTAIITIKLLEIGIVALVKISILSQLIVTFLEVIESISILENLTMLGVPLPSRFITLLLRYIRIPGLSQAINIGRNNQREVSEIEDMIKYHIPSFTNKCITKLLEIKFARWKAIVFHINKIFLDKGSGDEAHLYYKLLSLVELELNTMEKEWKNANIDSDCIDKFQKIHQVKLDHWMENMKTICYSNTPNDKKKNLLIDSIIVVLYQTILDAQKINGNHQ